MPGRVDRENLAELMLQIQRGQWDALRELYHRYSPGVYQLARRRLNDDRMAEDVVQEVFLRVWYHADKWDRDRGEVDTWILVIARHVIYDYLASERKDQSVLFPDEGILNVRDPEDAIAALIGETAMEELLEELSPEQRQIVRMVYAEGLPTHRVARVLHLPVGTVKSRLRLALAHLRRQLEKEAHSDGAL